MLSDLLEEFRDELIARCAAKVGKRPQRKATPVQLQNGVPLFLTQLQRTLEAEQTGRPMESFRISGASGGGASAVSEIGVGAHEHGIQLANLQYTIDQVVHDYGDLCQAITEVALERRIPLSNEEFRTLNRCLDNAIAVAVTAFSAHRGSLAFGEAIDDKSGAALGVVLSRLRNAVATATYASTALEVGNLPMSGATGLLLKRSLATLREQLGDAPPNAQ